MHSALVSVICVDAWIGKSGQTARTSCSTPRSCTSTRVDARLGQRSHGVLDRRQLAGESQRVERHVAPQSAAVQESHHLGQFFEAEIDGPVPGVKADLQTEIDRIGPVFDRGPDAVPIPSRGQQFGPNPWRCGRSRRDVRCVMTLSSCYSLPSGHPLQDGNTQGVEGPEARLFGKKPGLLLPFLTSPAERLPCWLDIQHGSVLREKRIRLGK